MTDFLVTREAEIRVFHAFCGIGAGARGFNRGHARVGNVSQRALAANYGVAQSTIGDAVRAAGRNL